MSALNLGGGDGGVVYVWNIFFFNTGTIPPNFVCQIFSLNIFSSIDVIFIN